MVKRKGKSLKNFNTDELTANLLDSNDGLKVLREEFVLPKNSEKKEYIYFCGNSLGPMPKCVNQFVDNEIYEWGRLGVKGHFDKAYPWVNYHEFVTKSLSKLVGAKTDEVIAMNTLTTNLHLLLGSFYNPKQEKKKILTVYNSFPSDQYALKSHLKVRGLDESYLVQIKPKGKHFEISDFEEALNNNNDVQLIVISGVHYLTGEFFQLKELSKLAKKYNCKFGVDLAHAVGNIPLYLHDWEVDFAVWCSYKYLNSGPGAIAGAFVHEKHLKSNLDRFAGWWGHDKKTRFKMDPNFIPIETAEGWQLSNPNIMALATLRASLSVFDKTTIEELRKKSVLMTEYLLFLLQEELENKIDVITPRDKERRGSQLSLICKEETENMVSKLDKNNIICDFREPNIIRVAPNALYNKFSEIYDFIQVLKNIL